MDDVASRLTDRMTTHDVATVERLIAAPADKIFDLLADPARHQEIDGSGTVRGTPEGSQRLALGSKFGMSMHVGLSYSMVSTVVEFEENRLIAWQPRPSIAPMRLFVGGRIWRYELVPQDGGTLVRESWDIRKEAFPFAVRAMRSKSLDLMPSSPVTSFSCGVRRVSGKAAVSRISITCNCSASRRCRSAARRSVAERLIVGDGEANARISALMKPPTFGGRRSTMPVDRRPGDSG